jgi:hypothetical protein
VGGCGGWAGSGRVEGGLVQGGSGGVGVWEGLGEVGWLREGGGWAGSGQV